MKKLTAIFALVLLMGTASMAKAGVYVSVGVPGPYCYPAPYYHHVYVPPVVYHRWVPGHGWVVYRPAHRVLAWNHYYHRWM
jgi:hypothetical protein